MRPINVRSSLAMVQVIGSGSLMVCYLFKYIYMGILYEYNVILEGIYNLWLAHARIIKSKLKKFCSFAKKILLYDVALLTR